MSTPLLAKTVINCGVPKLIEHAPNAIKAIWCRFFAKEIPNTPDEDFDEMMQGVFPEPINIVTNPLPKKPRKKKCMIPWTQVHYDYIQLVMTSVADFHANNPKKKKIRQYQVIDFLNDRMVMDKTRSAYAPFFFRTIDRDDLPQGKVYFDNKTVV